MLNLSRRKATFGKKAGLHWRITEIKRKNHFKAFPLDQIPSYQKKFPSV
jgi:hypothetical protein